MAPPEVRRQRVCLRKSRSTRVPTLDHEPRQGQIAAMEKLEEQIAHLTRAVDDLSEVVARQEGEIARLSAQVERLRRREAEREADTPGSVVLGNERPPHY